MKLQKLLTATGVFILFLLVLSSCSVILKGNQNGRELTLASLFERYPKGKKEVLRRQFWSPDGNRLYFASRASKRDARETILRYYDFETRQVGEVPTESFSMLYFSINECNEIAAVVIDYCSKRMGITLSSEEKFSFHKFQNIDLYSNPVWLNCAELVFDGSHFEPDSYDIFVWGKTYDVPKPVTAFFAEPPEGKMDPRRMVKSSVPGRIVFDYFVHREQDGRDKTTYHFGAMDVGTEKAWKIIDVGEGINRRGDCFNWFVSKTEDAIYFFQRDELLFLDSLWRIDSSGANLTKILDGEDIGKPFWFTHVSWSDTGKKFAFSINPDEDERFTGIYVVDVEAKKIREVISEPETRNYALSPDGKKLAYHNFGKGIFIIDLENGAEEMIYSFK